MMFVKDSSKSFDLGNQKSFFYKIKNTPFHVIHYKDPKTVAWYVYKNDVYQTSLVFKRDVIDWILSDPAE